MIICLFVKISFFYFLHKKQKKSNVEYLKVRDQKHVQEKNEN